MDPAYSWHPGAVCVKPRWAARVDLLPDEALSSWLARAAIANGCDPGAFFASLFREYRDRAAEISRVSGDDRLQVLEREGGVSVDALRRSTLTPVATSVQGQSPRLHGTWPWITTIGLERIRAPSGAAYCPACLRDDARPYLRLQWRFAWHTLCEMHGQPLRDRCPHCRRPPYPDRGTVDLGGLHRCSSCGRHLAVADAPAAADRAPLDLQAQTDRVLIHGATEYWGDDLSAVQWFGLLTTFLRGAQSAMRSPWNPWARALRSLGIERLGSGYGRQLEHIDVQGRARLLGVVASLVRLPRSDLAELWRTAGLGRTNVELPGDLPGHPLQTVMDELPDRTRAGRRPSTRHRLPEPRTRTQVAWKVKKLMEADSPPPGPENDHG
jgi:hypothetical protein